MLSDVRSKSKNLHNMGKFLSFYIAGESFNIKVHKNSTPPATTHVNDSEHHFPEVDSSPTSTSNPGSRMSYGVFLSLCVCMCMCLRVCGVSFLC